MSTYLIAYANGVFEYLESSYTSPLSGKIRPLRVYGTFLPISREPRLNQPLQPPLISFI